MSKRLAVVVACLWLFGCAPPPPPTTTSTIAVPRPLICDGTGACEVTIINPTCSGTTCTAAVDRDPVTFVKANNILIKWKLPDGFGFCASRGDGVFLKDEDPHDQFDDPRVDGPPRPGHACKRWQFVMTAKNTVGKLSFPYLIKFHSANGKTLYVIDPTMFND